MRSEANELLGGDLVCEEAGEHFKRGFSLGKRALVQGSQNLSIFNEWNKFWEEIRGDHLHSTEPPILLHGAVYRKAVGCIDVQPAQIGMFLEQIQRRSLGLCLQSVR